MKPILLGTICALLASAGTIASAAPSANAATAPAPHSIDTTSASAQSPVPPPRTNPKLKRILAAMDQASTDGHPDLFGQFAGMRRLFKGDYKGAMKYFKIGARFADKLSQLSLGMMYLHGRGASKDPATACAWITLAAERGYPSYVRARDRICGSLLPEQHDRAMATLSALLPEYGDATAKPRMKLQLVIARNALTGSLMGRNANNITVKSLEPFPGDCSGDKLNLGGVTVPIRGCGMYDPSLWDSKAYFAARDAQWYATVSVGPLTKVNAPMQTSDKKKTDDKP